VIALVELIDIKHSSNLCCSEVIVSPPERNRNVP
jgi:hypothetical protein